MEKQFIVLRGKPENMQLMLATSLLGVPTVANIVKMCIRDRNKEKKGKLTFDEIGASMAFYQSIGIIYLIYCFVGLMSSQWVLFLLIILLAFIPKRWLWWRYVDSLVTLLILVLSLIHISFALGALSPG